MAMDGDLANEPTAELVLHFVDDHGKHGTWRSWLLGIVTDITAAGPAAIQTAVKAISDLAHTLGALVNKATRTGMPAISAFDDTPYSTPNDKLVFKFKASDGSHVTMELPTPLSTSLMSTDLLRGDMANADVKAFTNYVIANLCTAEGVPLTGAVVYPAIRRRPKGRVFQF